MGTSQSSPPIEKVNEIKFYLHEKQHIVKASDISPNTSLNFYLRNTLEMKGTKGMCFEGGCGACVVVLQSEDQTTKKNVFMAVNSCLIPLLSCDGWRIITIEGIGNPVDGYHPLQEILARFYGTQCGFCSPGMVMTMYALYESGKFTMEQVENSFSGNLCRCTGYRPILSAFKSLSSDANPEILGKCPDIEDFGTCYKEKCAQKCANPCSQILNQPFYIEFPKSKWVKVHSLRDLMTTLGTDMTATYRLVAGNTAQGVYSSYKNEVNLYIDVTNVPELVEFTVDKNSCKLGANITLHDTIEIFNDVAQTSGFGYLKDVADHINLIANVPVRNRGTLAGNLMIKHDHHEFPSDVFLLLETVAATLTVVNILGVETELTPHDFINYDMVKQRTVLKTIALPAYANNVKFVSYKIMPRAENTHAIVNAGFLFKFDNNTVKTARIVYGNINPNFVHATASESMLAGKDLFDNSVLKKVYNSLDIELQTAPAPPDPSPQLRKLLAIALFYKAVLSIAPNDKISPKNKTGGQRLKRPVSSGTQDFQTNKSLYPLTEPITKLEALAQTSGIAHFVIDLPDLPFQLHAALVLADAPPSSVIRAIDSSEALKLDGVVAFLGKGDIPGDNVSVTLMDKIFSEEELFASNKVKYFDQPVGIIIAQSQELAMKAVDLVHISYNFPTKPPIISIRQVLKQGTSDRITEFKTINATRKGTNIKHVIKGSVDLFQQYHFHMETHTCQVVPVDTDSLDVYSSTQWMNLVQNSISRVLNIPQSKIHVIVRRCGGAFGGKISRANLVACATALAAWKLKKTVRMWLPLRTNMLAMGKRSPYLANYEVAVDDDGVIQYLNCNLYTDVGYQFVEFMAILIEPGLMGTYTSDTFTFHMSRVVTDTHVNSWTRAPGHLEAVTTMEAIMDHIAYTVNVDPLKVRQANLSNKTPLNKYVDDIKSWANIDQRKLTIANFNSQNRWRKKGMSVVPLSFELFPLGMFTATVSIFHGDGSVQIRHAGIEIGQGINTKAAQVCAYKFGIPLEKVRVLPSNSFVAPNAGTTGGSVTSEAICYCIIQACDKLLSRINPYRPQGTTWEAAIKTCYKKYVSLSDSGLYSSEDSNLKPYSIYGMCAIEVELDVLTGQHLVSKVDLIEDVGVTLSPYIDIGQVEGAFIMGLGYQTTEKIVYNEQGKILTHNTWTYHVPGAKDIPVEFNVKFPKDNPNPIGILNSKATGEPSLCFTVGIALAIRNAATSARTDASQSKWYPIAGVTDVAEIIANSGNDSSQYVL